MKFKHKKVSIPFNFNPEDGNHDLFIIARRQVRLSSQAATDPLWKNADPETQRFFKSMKINFMTAREYQLCHNKM